MSVLEKDVKNRAFSGAKKLGVLLCVRRLAEVLVRREAITQDPTHMLLHHVPAEAIFAFFLDNRQKLLALV